MIFAENNYNPNRIVNNRPFHAKVPHPRREEVIHEPSLLVISDANKCNLFLCIVAWLTIDDFRWHKIYPSVPEDLSYGLVLQYPDYILSCVEFVYHRKKLYGMDILPPIVENCEQFVKSNYSF
ncbi:hypothetical protein A5482_015980 (plasmid) [Cyanobacterium sp. IPPAS B-1200]|uniref:hypothetical protein n=1 Tax=Cyanobacterium sp. IPPAS B-1200 TaxID=1562720 RepID=UPI00114D1967|nr:hypothetical protein [Cyanobacterium sp. IPPAS B-1200]